MNAKIKALGALLIFLISFVLLADDYDGPDILASEEIQLAMSTDDDILLLIPSIVSRKGSAPPDPPNDPPDSCRNIIRADITSNTTWRNTVSSCDYLIQPLPLNSRIPTVVSATLTIEPGVTVRFAPNASLLFRDGGRLVAEGTPGSRIRFDSFRPSVEVGFGLYFTTNSGVSRMRYADLVNLGNDNGTTSHDAAIAGTRSSGGLSLRDTRISGSKTSGALLEDLNITAFANNRFFGNALFGVEISAAQMFKLDEQSDYIGNGSPNGRPFVEVTGVGTARQVEQSATWNNLNAPYFVNIKIDIKDGDITVQPGTEFVFDEGAGLDVEDSASFRAVGTANNPIIFTGAESIRGYWDGLFFTDSYSTNNRLENVEVRYGGGAFFDANIASFDSRITVTNSTVTDSDTWGICVDNNSIGTITNNSYGNNRNGNVTFNC